VGSPPLELGDYQGSSCLACCYGSPCSQEERSCRKVPMFCVEDFSNYVRPRETGQVDLQYMGDLSTSWLGNSILQSYPNLPCRWILVSTGLCAIWTWNSSRTGLPGPHCGAQDALISASHPDSIISWCGSSKLVRLHEGTVTGTYWSDFISSLAFRIH
jgi:hypothetical protein